VGGFFLLGGVAQVLAGTSELWSAAVALIYCVGGIAIITNYRLHTAVLALLITTVVVSVTRDFTTPFSIEKLLVDLLAVGALLLIAHKNRPGH
jgi:hypothetical protein